MCGCNGAWHCPRSIAGQCTAVVQLQISAWRSALFGFVVSSSHVYRLLVGWLVGRAILLYTRTVYCYSIPKVCCALAYSSLSNDNKLQCTNRCEDNNDQCKYLMGAQKLKGIACSVYCMIAKQRNLAKTQTENRWTRQIEESASNWCGIQLYRKKQDIVNASSARSG